MLVSMGVITYFIPYLFLFASMIRLQSRPSSPRAIRLPGGKWTAIPLACIGLVSTTCTIILSLFPAEDDANPTATIFKVLIMTLLLLGAGVAIYYYSRRSLRASALARGYHASLEGGSLDICRCIPDNLGSHRRKEQRMNTSLSELLDLYNANAPLEEAHTIPAAWYLDERIEVLEREQVFGRNWIAVGRVDQAAVPGQFFTVELAGEPLVVVRGADGELRAFYNVCRHHAAAVANVPCGIAQHLRCPYHGWTYGLDGSLKGAPEFAGVCNFDRAQNGLIPVRVATWEQFVFVTLE